MACYRLGTPGLHCYLWIDAYITKQLMSFKTKLINNIHENTVPMEFINLRYLLDLDFGRGKSKVDGILADCLHKVFLYVVSWNTNFFTDVSPYLPTDLNICSIKQIS
jgi:hypothetical protein